MLASNRTGLGWGWRLCWYNTGEGLGQALLATISEGEKGMWEGGEWAGTVSEWTPGVSPA